MIGVVLVSIGLTAVVGALCTVLYLRLQSLSALTLQLRKQVGHLEICMQELVGLQTHISRSVNNLAKDVLQREIYQTDDDRHQLAISAAKEGQSVAELVRKHGLSSDEAALIIALHGGPSIVGDSGRWPVSPATKAFSTEMTERG